MSKPVFDLLLMTKKSPEARSCPVTVIFGIWKKPFVKVTDFVPVPEATSSPVSVLFSKTNLAFNPVIKGLALLFAEDNTVLNLKNLPLNVPCCATVVNLYYRIIVRWCITIEWSFCRIKERSTST